MDNVASALERLATLASSPHVARLARAFDAAGFELALVGGPVRDAFLDVVSRDLPKAWVRQCGRITPLSSRLSDRKGLLLDILSAGFRARAVRLGVRTNPAFAGSYDFHSDPDFAALFPRFLDGLPAGSVVMCHPGFVDDTLRRLDPLTDLREREYAFFAAETFPKLMAANRVTLA